MQLPPAIPPAYDSLLGAFDAQALLSLARQWFKRPPEQWSQAYQIAPQYQPHVRQCQRIAQYRDADDEPVAVVVIHTQQHRTWVHKHSLLHAVAVQAMRRWAITPDWRALVAFVAPDGVQWRLQYIAQEIESQRNRHGTFTPQQRVTPAVHYRMDMAREYWQLLPMAYWDALAASAIPIQPAQLKEACMTVPATPTEAFERAYNASIAAIDAYERALQASTTSLSFAERAKIHEQLVKLHQLADQWQQAAQPLLKLMRIDNIQPTQPAQHGTPVGDRLTLSDSWRFRKPTAIQHGGQVYAVKHWQGVYAAVIHALISSHGEAFITKMNQSMQASSRPFLSQQAEIYDRAAQVDGWYYEATQSADQMAAHIRRMYQLCNLPLDSFVVWVQVG